MSVNCDDTSSRLREDSTSSGHMPFILCIVDQIGGLSNGGAIRQHHLVRALTPLGDTMVLVLDRAASGEESKIATALGAPVTVSSVPPVSKARALGRMVREPLLPWRLARSDTPRIREAIDALTKNGAEPDLFWVSSLAGWKALTPERRSRTVFDLIDRPTAYHAEQLRTAGRRWWRAFRHRRRRSPLSVSAPSPTTVLKDVDGWMRSWFVERWLAQSCRLDCLMQPGGAATSHVRESSNRSQLCRGSGSANRGREQSAALSLSCQLQVPTQPRRCRVVPHPRAAGDPAGRRAM